MRHAHKPIVAWARCARRVIVAISAFRRVRRMLLNSDCAIHIRLRFRRPLIGVAIIPLRFGYYVLVACISCCFVIFFVTLFLSARRSLRSMLFPIGVIVGVAGVVYGVSFYAPPCCDADVERRAYLLHFGHGAHRTHARFGLLPRRMRGIPLGVFQAALRFEGARGNGDTVFQTEMAQAYAPSCGGHPENGG